MKIFLQDCQTLKYMRCDSQWTSALEEALDFASVRRATVYALSALKHPFQLVQMEGKDIGSRAVALVPKLPVIQLVKVPRPARSARTVCSAQAIHGRIRPLQNWRQAGQFLAAALPALAVSSATGSQP